MYQDTFFFFLVIAQSVHCYFNDTCPIHFFFINYNDQYILYGDKRQGVHIK